MNKPKLSTVRDLVLIIGVFLIAAQLILPAPYDPGYLFKRAFYDPHFICKDGSYSYAVSDQGACSNHQGIDQEFTPDSVKTYKPKSELKTIPTIPKLKGLKEINE